MAVLTPVSKIQFNQFKDLYDPNLPYNQQNLMLQSKMDENTFNQYSKIANEEKNLGFFDKLGSGLANLFAAQGAEMPQVPNLDYGYSMPTFDLGTGITNTSAALPFRSMVDMQEAANQDIVQQIIAENQAENYRRLMTQPSTISGPNRNFDLDPYQKNFLFPNKNMMFTTGMYESPTTSQSLGMDTSYETALPQILAGQSDFERNLLEPVVERKKSALEEMMSKGVIGGIGTFLSGILPQDPPEVRRVKDFYARNFGVNTAGSVASGIMKGYNPVSGGFLNYMTGGKYGEPMQVGLGRAMQRRIENILGRKAPQTDASRAKVEELRNLQLQEMRDRAAGGESLGSIGKSTFSGKGGAFEAKPSGAYSKGFAGGR
jgi:hypothetical protein